MTSTKNEHVERGPEAAGETVGAVFVGCGYAADFYGATLPNYPHIEVKAPSTWKANAPPRSPVSTADASSATSGRCWPIRTSPSW